VVTYTYLTNSMVVIHKTKMIPDEETNVLFAKI